MNGASPNRFLPPGSTSGKRVASAATAEETPEESSDRPPRGPERKTDTSDGSRGLNGGPRRRVPIGRSRGRRCLGRVPGGGDGRSPRHLHVGLQARREFLGEATGDVLDHASPGVLSGGAGDRQVGIDRDLGAIAGGL